jgi:hypothetical protein
MWLAPLFYFTYLTVHQTAWPAIVISLFFEITALVFWLQLVSKLIACVNARECIDLPRLTLWLKLGIGVQIAIAAYLFLQDGFGLLAEGSRIEYLADSRLNLYLTYLGALNVAVQISVVAAIISYKNKWDAWALSYIILMMILSIISGSKGSGLLIVIALVCYVRLPSFKNYLRLLMVPIIFGTIFVLTTVIYVGNFLQIESDQMISLMISRFLLVNDGRALAIDFANQLNQSNISLFQESFRAIASAAGSPPINIPLGQLLYSEAFSTVGLLGANTSATALLIAYGGGIEKILFLITLLIFACIIYRVFRRKGKYSVVRLPIGLLLLNLLTQDFMAFQVTTNILMAIAFAIYLFKLAARALNIANSKFYTG